MSKACASGDRLVAGSQYLERNDVLGNAQNVKGTGWAMLKGSYIKVYTLGNAGIVLET